MFENIDWVSFLPAFIGALIPVLGLVVSALIAWGRMTQTTKHQGEKQAITNGRVDEQAKKDTSLQSEIEGIKARNEAKEWLWRMNNEAHSEMHARICALEKGLASLPLQVSEMIDDKLKQWREYSKEDMRKVIREIDQEKMKFQRRKTNGTHKEDEWD